jgi:hypothetical protein
MEKCILMEFITRLGICCDSRLPQLLNIKEIIKGIETQGQIAFLKSLIVYANR